MAQVQSNQIGIEVLLFPIAAPAINVNQLGLEVLLHPVPPPQINVNQCGLEVLFPYIPPSAFNVFNFTTMPSSPLPSSIQVSLIDATETTDDEYTGQVITYPYEAKACAFGTVAVSACTSAAPDGGPPLPFLDRVGVLQQPAS